MFLSPLVNIYKEGIVSHFVIPTCVYIRMSTSC